MTLQSWFIFVIVAILPVLSPGPAILLAISNSIRYGPSATVYSALANAIGSTILGFAVAFGLSALIDASAFGFAAMKIVGALYLGYLGLKLWRSGDALNLAAAAKAPVKTRKRVFAEALFLAVTNPKSLVLLAALLPPFTDRSQPIFQQAAILSITFAVMCFCNHLFLAYAAGRARRFLASERRLVAVRHALGTLFIGFGAALALTAR